MINFVSRIHRLIEMAPLITRFDIREVALDSPELKNLNGYHSDSVMPENINIEMRLSIRLMFIKLP
jgi:hypothetical protein